MSRRTCWWISPPAHFSWSLKGMWKKNYLILHVIAGHKATMAMTYCNLPPQLCPILFNLSVKKRSGTLEAFGEGLPVHTISNTSQHFCSKWLDQQFWPSTEVPPHLRQWKQTASTTAKPKVVMQPHINLNTQVKMCSLNPKPAGWFSFRAFPQYQREKLEKWTWCKEAESWNWRFSVSWMWQVRPKMWVCPKSRVPDGQGTDTTFLSFVHRNLNKWGFLW